MKFCGKYRWLFVLFVSLFIDSSRTLAAEVAEDVDGSPDLALGFRQRLAFLTRHVRCDRIELPIEDVGHLKEKVAARGTRQTRPRPERRLCRVCRAGVGGSVARAGPGDKRRGVPERTIPGPARAFGGASGTTPGRNLPTGAGP